ncbi:MAG: sensor histidine kinase [Actinomycetota bacterium]
MTDLVSVVRSLPDAIIVFDNAGRVTAWLGAAEQLFGWKAGEAEGQDLQGLLRPRSPGGEDARISEPVATSDGSTEGVGEESDQSPGIHGPLEQELIVKTKDLDEVWVGAIYAKEQGSATQPGGTIVVLRDIWRKKRVDLEKSEVISSVAHEIRSPLTSIKGFASTLVRRWDRFEEQRRKQILLTIEADADRVTRLVVELLDVSRLDEGRLQLNKRPITVASIASRVVDRLRPTAPNHVLEIDFVKDLPDVSGDPDKVEQVITNLVENAIKYTEGGTVIVSGSSSPSGITIGVADEGEGIPQEDRQSVFLKFFRRGSSEPGGAAPPPGTGLGLYISKGLVEAHGGKIWIEETSGGGALFAFTLPRQ